MKKILLAVAVLIVVGLVVTAAQYISPKQTVQTSGCPQEGSSTKDKFKELDKLKNRTEKKSYIDENLDVKSFLKGNDDRKLFSNDMYVTITGYVVLVKYGGAETCECESKEKNDEDYHIEIAENPGETDKTKTMICEITREVRCIDYKTLEKYKGHKVKIEGFLFFDEEHWQNALNTNPSGTNLWRGTCWEIHPVFSITIID